MTPYKSLLRRLFLHGVDKCRAATTLPSVLPIDKPSGRTILLGMGKASADMAEVAARCLGGEVSGCVVTRYGHTTLGGTGPIEVREAGHPYPDDNCIAATQRIYTLAESAQKGDRVIFLISGGGSALLTLPADGISLEEKRAITRHLLCCGSPIDTVNLVRRHLSKVKGGRLAAAAKNAELYSFVLSDVVGDNAADVASGPTVATQNNPERVLAILNDSGYPVSMALRNAVVANSQVETVEHTIKITATNDTALDAIAGLAEAEGWEPLVLRGVQGNARDVGCKHAQLAMDLAAGGGRHAIISGGELTVRVTNAAGRGGPNLEYLTAFAMALRKGVDVEAIACDSDGIDGSEGNAGGYISNNTMTRWRQSGMDPNRALRDNDTYSLFEALGDLVLTGPTLTNVNDVRIALLSKS